MRRDDLHPEELLVRVNRRASSESARGLSESARGLSKSARGLSNDDEADLRAHLDRCPACALQLELRGEIAGALTPTEDDYEIAARAVARVLAAEDWPANVLTLAPGASRDGTSILARVAVVLAILLGTGVAASALMLGTRGRLWGRPEPATVVAPPLGRPAPRGRVARTSSPPIADAPATAEQPVTVEAPAVMAPVVAPTSPAVAPAASAPRMRHAPPSFPLDPPTPSTLAPSEPPPAVTAPAAPTPSVAVRAPELFAAAEHARRDGNAAEAQRLYGQLSADFAGTREEIASRVLMGQLLLDDLRRPVEALASFERYLHDAPVGALAEEARVGRAQALWDLGRAREEAAAWNELLTRNPRSLHVELARRRIAALATSGE